MEVLRKLKADKRSEAGLSDIKEDTLTVSKTMRAASPPASAADILEATNNRRNNRPSKILNYVFENRIIKIGFRIFFGIILRFIQSCHCILTSFCLPI